MVESSRLVYLSPTYVGRTYSFVVHKLTIEIHPESAALMEKVAQEVETKGIQAWWDLDSAALLGSELDNYEKVTTLDVWFDSGVTHYFVVDRRDDIPASIYILKVLTSIAVGLCLRLCHQLPCAVTRLIKCQHTALLMPTAEKCRSR